MNLKEIVAYLSDGNFEGDDGSLETTFAFRELKRMADNPVEFLSDIYHELSKGNYILDNTISKIRKSEGLEPIGYIITTKEVTPELLMQIDKHIDRKIKSALDKYSL